MQAVRMDADAEIIPDHPVPPYRQLAAILSARIRRGDWEPDRPIPSEPRLVQEYGVARNTVRRAVALLSEEGIVYVVPRRGVYVSPGQHNVSTRADTDRH